MDRTASGAFQGAFASISYFILSYLVRSWLHFLNGALALNDSHSLTLANSETWSCEVSQGHCGSLSAVSHIDVESKLQDHVLPLVRAVLLRRQFYDAMAKQLLYDMLPQLRPCRSMTMSPKPCMCRAVMAWYTASPDTHLPRGPNSALPLRQHLGLPPVFAPDQRCCCRPSGYGSPLLNRTGPAWKSCAHTVPMAPASADTTSVRDAWAAIIKTAHWRCDTEQVVRTGEGTCPHRADLVATAPDGTLWALDASITANSGRWQIRCVHTLERTAAAKASALYPRWRARQLPDGHTLVPLIHSADHGWLSLEGLAFLQRILTQIAGTEPPLGISEWKPHVA